MDNYKLIERLNRIVRYLKDYPGISKRELLAKLAESDREEITIRTLERDIKNLRERFYLEINYNRAKNGYFLNPEFQHDVDEWIRFMEFAELGQFFRSGLTDFKSFGKLVQLHQTSFFLGIELLKPIVLAIRHKQNIQFLHINYWEETEKPYTIGPLMIREYLNRWYVIGVPQGKKEIRTFGLDRIKELQTAGSMEIKTNDFEKQLEQFNKIVGLNFNAGDGKLKIISLRVYYKHLKYLQSLPLHHSQKIDWAPGETHGTVKYHLIPNYEFKVQILKMGNLGEVISPAELRQEIKQMLKETLRFYQ
ncbi:helix-turn-helix transcriptional regulator [Flavimarina sp. Hel_I_48]|uniref:helix-turn-helix transcriptional regulator n=1 Tax=Flavimarina sp. Hel_I_48 TaxID=1392488 RepID=UPI0004DFBAB9|nr:WYL domain-containing protein [Flavimarina sp. Hel_I_48]